MSRRSSGNGRLPPKYRSRVQHADFSPTAISDRPGARNMRRFIQRWITSAVLSAGIVAAAVSVSYGQEKVVRIGFQKYGKLVLLKSRGTLEENLKPLGYKVSWTEFPSGPPLLEALNVGAIDFGIAGETPPIFAQAAGAPLVYLAY